MSRVARRPRHHRVQRGVTTIIVLLALVIMLVAAVGLVKAFNATLFMSGNLAFKRDLVNQAERASAAAMDLLKTGDLSTSAARAVNNPALNYRAQMYTVMQPGETGCPSTRVNAQGIPCVLLSDAAFAGAGVTSNDIAVTAQGVNVRWILERLCNGENEDYLLGSANCVVGPTPDARGGSATEITGPTLQAQVMYRLSVRVDGPRSTQAFFQSTFAL